MLIHDLTLDLVPGASDQEIRRRYLEMVKENPPAAAPERFRKIAAAYEALQNSRSRVASRLFGFMTGTDAETEVNRLVEAGCRRSKQPGLRDLCRRRA